ncbi:MAG: chorismate synthase [Clostridia bacterium]|nr:chorismate synthase [Clostridia bacterium]
MSTIGNKLKMTIYGESHGPEIGVVLTNFPKNVTIDTDKLLVQMARRAPGNGSYGTTRKEPDLPIFLSGVENNVTTGDDIHAVIKNQNAHSNDYDNLKYTPRPGHADYTAKMKYGDTVNMSGGGPFSGRLTAPLVIAGALCRQILAEKGIVIAAHVKSMADIEDTCFDTVNPDIDLMNRLNSEPFAVIDTAVKEKMTDAMADARKDMDSIGGVVELMVIGMPVGIGGELFDGVEGKLASYIYGIPAVKGVEFGAGFSVAKMCGSESNDEFCYKKGKVVTKTNNCGGILGGISNGMPITLKVAFKPTPSIAKVQNTVDLQSGENTTLQIKGRHDPCVVPRAVVCVESAVAVAITDMLMENGVL